MHKIGNIPVSWTLPEIENLDYFFTKFNDDESVQNWLRLYRREFTIGEQADYRTVQPEFTKQVIKDIIGQGIVLDNIGTSFYRMHPGDMLPYHQDQYVSYCRYNNVDTSRVYRIIVFLQDWQPVFIFEIENQPVVQYTAGTYVFWHSDAPHLVGNMGSVPRYTLQITGTLNE